MTRPRLTLQAILILLKYRALTDYRDPVYLGPRIGDKLVFSLIVLTLYLGEGGEMAPAKVRSLEQSLAVSGPLGTLLGLSGSPLRPSWAVGPLGPCWGPLGSLLGRYWGLLGPPWSVGSSKRRER